jgi:predicted transcriptional regulator
MTKKLEKEHFESIQKLRKEFASISNILGNISIERYAIQQELDHLNEQEQKFLQQFETLKKQETELMSKLKEKYGDGQINIEDGTFTPS